MENGYQQQGRGAIRWAPTIAGAVGGAKTPDPEKIKRMYPPRAIDIVPNGRLNRSWADWLMGFPTDWTEAKELETHKFHSWLRSHGIDCTET
jgi:hypothetical protein